jgi:hypothetical protein
MTLNFKHDQWKLDGYCPCGTILSACTAVPAFLRVPNIHPILLHVNDIQGTVFVTDTAKVAFIRINNGWHAFSSF